MQKVFTKKAGLAGSMNHASEGALDSAVTKIREHLRQHSTGDLDYIFTRETDYGLLVKVGDTPHMLSPCRGGSNGDAHFAPPQLDTQGAGAEDVLLVERSVPTIPIASVPSIFSYSKASTPITWALDETLPMGAVSLLTADSGLLKSTLANAIARAMADGDRFAGIATTQRPVLILDRGENSLPSVIERYSRLNIKDGNGLIHFGDWVGDVPGPDSPAVIQFVEESNPKPLIIIDSMISFLEGDENEAMVVRKFMRPLRKLATMGAGVVLQHHSGKDASKKYRGSSDIRAAVDVAYSLEGIGDPLRLNGVIMTAFKGRFTVRPKLTLKFDGHRFWSDESGPSSKTQSERLHEQLRDLLIANPGIKTREFEELASKHKLPRDGARKFLDDEKTQGTINITKGDNNAKVHTWVGDAGGTK